MLENSSTGADLKQQAFEYLETIKQSPDAWIFYANQFFTDVYKNPTTRFSCLQVGRVGCHCQSSDRISGCWGRCQE